MRKASGGTFCLLILLVIFFALEGRKVLALTASIGPDGCNAQALHLMDPPLTGQGILIGVFSQKHGLVTHEAFHNKDLQGYPTGDSYAVWFDATGGSIYEPDITDPVMPGHDTSMCGIVGSRGGRLYPSEIGVAPGCEILSVRISKPVSDTDPTRQISVSWIKRGLDELLSQGGRVVVTGVQLSSSVIADGTSPFSLVYDFYAYNNDMIFINAAGNDATRITVFGDGFNGLTTGGLIMPETGIYRKVGTASNPGPTTDGRRKPEIMAPAQNLQLPTSSSTTAWTNRGTTRGETSWAGPHAAGVATLLLQYANSTTTVSDDNKGAVIKAVMINSTFPNILTETGQSTTNQIWNAQRGYGRVDALRAYQILSRPKVAKNVNISQSAGWTYQYISQSNQLDTYRILGTKNQRLLLTMTWHRAVRRIGPSNSTDYEDEALPKFNLDMRIYDPQGNLVFDDSGTPDNLRKVDIRLYADGYYKVELNSNQFATGRYYAMAFELLEPLEADFNVDSIVDTADLITLAGSWLADNCTNTAQPCYRLDLFADGQIDYQDMATMSADWLTIDPRYYPVP